MRINCLIAIMALWSMGSCSTGTRDNDHHAHHDIEHEEHMHHEHEHEDENEHEHEHHHHAESSDEHVHADEIHLSVAQAQQFGVIVDTLRLSDFMSGITVPGKIISAPNQQAVVAAPSSGIVSLSSGINPGCEVSRGRLIAAISARGTQGGDPMESARIAYEAAKRELDRLTPLHKEGIVSTARYNEALRTVELTHAAMSGKQQSGSTATSPISGTLTQILVSQGEFVQVGQPLATVAAGTSLLLQADVPVKDVKQIRSVKDVQIKLSYNSDCIILSELGGHRVDAPAAMTADPNRPSGYRPIYFTFNNPGFLTPGMAVEVNLLIDEGKATLSLPKSGLIEQEGHYFAFVQVHPDAYEKRMVTIGASNGAEYEILSGLHAGEAVVTQGATIVKLAAASGRVPEGHSHNH